MTTQAEHRDGRAEMYDAEVIDSTDLVPYQQAAPAPSDLFGAGDPVEVVRNAQKVAEALKDVLTSQGLTQKISGKDHVLVTGWTLLGSMLGVFPVCTWTHKLDNGWEARVEARTRAGEVVGAAEAMCTRDERMWAGRDDYAIRSMAQTRATSKALRQPLGFVVTLAGYAETPAEEIPHSEGAGDAPLPSSASPAMISDAQHRKIGVLLKELDQEAPQAEGQLSWVAMLRERSRVQSRKEMTKEQASEAIDWLEKQLSDASIPFG